MTNQEQTVVAIIGGGPAGASAALELARHGIDTVVLERGDGRGNPIGECLAPTAMPLLQQLGLEDVLVSSNALASHGNRSAWGDGTTHDHDFLREPLGCGWHLDRSGFNACLLDKVVAAGVRLWPRTSVFAVGRGGGSWLIEARAGETPRPLHARLLIDASGRRAVVARRQRVRRHIFDTLVAAVAVLTQDECGEEFRDATTMVEAMACGWWYAALLPERRLAIAWFTDPDLLIRTGAERPAGWWHLLQATDLIGGMVREHGFGKPENIRLAPAGSSLLSRPAGGAWIAAGDAAAAFDPLSSHGIASALASGAAAGRAAVSILGGDASAAIAYCDRVFADYARYLWLRHAYYTAEQRWPTAAFWQRRAAAT